MKHTLVKLFILFLSAAALFLTSCPLILLEKPMELNSDLTGDQDENTGLAEISFGEIKRTLLPELGPLTYILEFYKDGESSPAVTETTASPIVQAALPAGNYTLVVGGYETAGADSSKIAAEGHADFTVTAGGQVSVTVDMNLLQNGTGTFSYALTIPAGLTEAGGSIHFKPFFEENTLTPIDITLPANLTGSEEISSGYYLVTIRLSGTTGSDYRVLGKTVIAHINDNLETKAVYTFTLFELIPIPYTVTISNLQNGTITADPQNGPAGTAIALTVNPNTGYRLKDGTLKYNDGSDHAITGTSFNLPAANVTVTAEFELIPVPTYSVTIGNLQNGTITPNPQNGPVGTAINLTVNPNTDYRLKAGTLKYNDGEDHAITETSFALPAANVTVTAEFELIPYTVPVSVTVAVAPEEWNLVTQSESVVKGTTAQFSVTGTYTGYAWYLDGSPVGTNTALYNFDTTVSGINIGDVYELVVVVTAGNGERRSGRCRVTVTEVTIPSYSAATPAEFATALSNIQNSDESTFAVVVGSNLSLAPVSLSGAGYSGKTITVKGNAGTETISLSSAGSLFTVGEDVTLMMNAITLIGRDDNNASLVTVDGGEFTMNEGAKVIENKVTVGTATREYGGGVLVKKGVFTLDGGEVSNNYVDYSTYSGGGVAVINADSEFIMKGGKIKDNYTSSNYASDSGGGVYLAKGASFTMYDGEISGNESHYTFFNHISAGGVYVSTSTFIMNGGKISNNIASSTTGSRGGAAGGVLVIGTASFIMYDGEISGNTATHSHAGGGVAVNTYSPDGISGAVFTKAGTGGIIYGSGAPSDLANTANGNANAVYSFLQNDTVYSDIKVRNATVHETDAMDSNTAGNAGGWE